MFDMKKNVVNQDRNEEYIGVTWAALEKYPEDYLKQLDYVKEHGTKQHYALWLLNRVQDISHIKSTREITLNGVDIDLICRSFMDAMRYMQPNLSDGVYNYIINRMEDPMLDIIQKFE